MEQKLFQYNDTQFLQNQQQLTELEQQIQKEISENNFTTLQNNLQKKQDLIEITQILSFKGHTLIHKTILQRNNKLFFDLIQYAIQQLQKTKKQLHDWLQKPSQDGNTALHYAAYTGNIEILESLILNFQLDTEIFNNDGLKPVHLAAQGNKPQVLCYFKMLGIDIDCLDNKRGTALHWACYLGNEEAVEYLEQLTPLHLAVVNGNSKIVKRLLIKGADKTIQDSLGKTPEILAKESNFNNIYDMLTQSGGLSVYCNMKQPFKQVKKSIKQVILFLFLYILSSLIFYFLILPCFQTNSFIYFIPGFIFNLFTLTFFLFSWLKGSDFKAIDKKQSLKKAKTISLNETLLTIECQDIEESKLFKLYQNQQNTQKICVECQIYKPQRSRHCEVCKKCIKVYDHHCPWINNCVGANNILFFYVYLFSLWVNILYFISVAVIFINQQKYNCFNFDYYIRLSGIVFVIGICFIFFFPLSVLLFVQTTNILLNITTFERFSIQNKNQKKVKQDDEQNVNQQMNNSFAVKNCFLVCCENKNDIQYEVNQ